MFRLTITKWKVMGFLSLNCIWKTPYYDIYEIGNLTFFTSLSPDLHYKRLKIASHGTMDTVIEFIGQSWPGNMWRMKYLRLKNYRDLSNWVHSGLSSGRQPHKCKHVPNVDIFYFDLTCDVISDTEVNKIRFRSTTLAELFFFNSKIGAVTS